MMKLYALGAASFMALACAPVGVAAISNSAASSAVEAFLTNAPFGIRAAPASVVTPDKAAIKAALLAGNYTSKLHDTSRMLCPPGCRAAGADVSHGFAYRDVGRLQQCNETMLVHFSLLSEFDNPRSSNKIFACTADLNTAGEIASTAASCPQVDVNRTQVTSSVQMVSSGASSGADVASIFDTLAQLQASYRLSESSCKETIRFAYSTTAAVGIYVGSQLASQNVIDSVLDQLSTVLTSDGGVPESLAVQLCSSYSSRYALGLFISTKSDLSAAQEAVQTWKNGSCISDMEQTTPGWHNVTFLAPNPVQSVHNNSVTSSKATTLTVPASLAARATTCTTIQVAGGDTCSSLATECGITAAQFTVYNPSATECSTLAVGEYVCCSAGTLPDHTPKPNSAGYCYSYAVASGDTCSAIAAAHGITTSNIASWNDQTWGWTGCSNLFVSDLICLSTGYPPMPASIPNALCGPQVNNTPTAPHGTDFTTINECALNACCDIWGQCGTTAEFCTVSKSTTGNPGTAAPGKNGCISNCGTDIVSSSAPASTFKIAYFEGFDWSRPCLNAGLQDLDFTGYTHVHFGFAGINTDWSINTTAIDVQFPFLRALQGVKKIISIGGWAFCTDLDTYAIFRNVVASESSRSALVSNIVAFMNDNDLDGVDIDWEYPDEPDIPGIPAGTEAESTGFYLLLEELQVSIAANAPGKTISITAPASFWYLQYFPILALSTVVDYIVYMTYDLHGQWDYGRSYSDTGCSGGNCLRSHINMTESVNALSMITKAGVPSNMIAVGISSYARTFKMTTAGCWTEMCTYVGPDSGALPGPCTETGGILGSYEIDLVIAENPSAQLHWDQDSYSNILVYNNTEWAAYMNDTNKETRKLIYNALGFLGSSDWAVDQQSDPDGSGDDTDPNGSGTSTSTVYISPDIWASASVELTMLPGVTLVWPPKPLATTTTISFPLWTTTVSYSSLTTLTSTRADGSTSTYPWYIYAPIVTVITIPTVTTTEIPVWAVSIGTEYTDGVIYLTSSVQPDPFPVTVTPVISGTTSILSPTATSTSSGGIYIWGGLTEVLPPATATLGSSTTIIGGTTLAPVVVTVTPNPHPTQTQTTQDPALNGGSVLWLSGGPPGPPRFTSLPGCKGCGIPCLLFCDPGCPTCPPGVFGNSAGDGDDDSSSSTSSTSSGQMAHTVELVATGVGDLFVTDVPALSDLLSLESAQISMWNSEYPDDQYSITSSSTSTTPKTTAPKTTAPKPTTSTTTTTSIPTPTAECYFWDEDLVAFQFKIFNIAGWSTDKGAELRKQENGCGALTFWSRTEATSSEGASVIFNLPFFIKKGCVERAIVSAGGPKLSCKGKGSEFLVRKRSLDPRAADDTAMSLTEEKLYALQIIYGNDTSLFESYVPMNWAELGSS